MTVKELRTLVDNLEEYIHIPGGVERLKKTILHLAVSGQLVPQDPAEGTGEELYQQIQAEKAKLIKEGKLRKQKPIPAINENEVPFKAPQKWQWARFGEIVINLDDKRVPLSKIERTTRKGRYNYYGASGVIDKIDNYIFDKENLLIGEDGANLINRSTPIAFIATGQYWVNNHAHVLSAVHSETLHFLKNYINSISLEPYITGTAQPKMNQAKMNEILVPLPTIKEQRRIIDKVEIIFRLIDELAEKYKAEQAERQKLVVSSLAHLARGESDIALKHLGEIICNKSDAAQLRKTILHLAVSGQLVPQDPSEGTGEELYKQIQAEKAKLIVEGRLKKQKPIPEITADEIPFEIPKTWKWTRLYEIGRVVGGGTPSSTVPEYYTDDHENGIAWLTPADLRDYREVYISHGKRSITEMGLQNSSAQLMPKNTVLFSSRAPIGHLAIAANDITTNQGFKSVVPYDGLEPEYIYRWLQFYGPVIDSNASGTTFREVSGTIVAQQPIPLPPLAEQARIVQKTTQLLDLVAKLEQRLEK